MSANENDSKRMVIITTERRGVFVGRLASYDDAARVAQIEDARMIIYWGTTDGLFQLAATGPTPKTKPSAKVPTVRLELCECVIDVAPEAEAAWSRL
jgi:hypothetical protein